MEQGDRRKDANSADDSVVEGTGSSDVSKQADEMAQGSSDVIKLAGNKRSPEKSEDTEANGKRGRSYGVDSGKVGTTSATHHVEVPGGRPMRQTGMLARDHIMALRLQQQPWSFRAVAGEVPSSGSTAAKATKAATAARNTSAAQPKPGAASAPISSRKGARTRGAAGAGATERVPSKAGAAASSAGASASKAAGAGAKRQAGGGDSDGFWAMKPARERERRKAAIKAIVARTAAIAEPGCPASLFLCASLFSRTAAIAKAGDKEEPASLSEENISIHLCPLEDRSRGPFEQSPGYMGHLERARLSTPAHATVLDLKRFLVSTLLPGANFDE
ncbi:hypothetical protein T484DRAFT_1843448, partial [Baffinella frigidus]